MNASVAEPTANLCNVLNALTQITRDLIGLGCYGNCLGLAPQAKRETVKKMMEGTKSLNSGHAALLG